MGVPSYSKPPATISLRPMTMSLRSSGQAALGRTPREDGAARRSTPTRSRSWRRMMALVGWVVPSMALPSAAGSSTWAITALTAAWMPPIGSAVVAALVAATTVPAESTTTASVLVPPTSTPSLSDFIAGSPTSSLALPEVHAGSPDSSLALPEVHVVDVVAEGPRAH